MSEQDCPVEGCDYRGERPSLKGHITAKSDPEHDWSELKDQIDQADDHPEGRDGRQTDDQDDQGDDPPADPPEGGGSSDAGTDDQADQDVQDPQGGTDDQNDHPSDDPMPTQEELEKQRSSIDHPDDGGDDNTSKGQDSDPSGPSTALSGGIPLPFSTTTLVVGVVLVLMLGLLFTYVRTSSTDQPDQQVEDDQEDEDEVDDDQEDVLEDFGEGSLMGGGD